MVIDNNQCEWNQYHYLYFLVVGLIIMQLNADDFIASEINCYQNTTEIAP